MMKRRRVEKKLFCVIKYSTKSQLNWIFDPYKFVHKNQYWVNKAIEMSRYFTISFYIYLFHLLFVFVWLTSKKFSFWTGIVKVLCSASSGKENFELIIIIFSSDILSRTWFAISWILCSSFPHFSTAIVHGWIFIWC